MSTVRKTLILLALLALGAAALAAYALREDIHALKAEVGSRVTRALAGEGGWFAAIEPPLRETHHLFDLGVVDADGDGRLDVYTSNHNYRQVLLLNRADDAHTDVLTAWGMDQYRDFPGWEQSFKGPDFDKPGLYVYWLGDTLTLRAYGLDAATPLAGSVAMHSRIDVEGNEGFEIREEIRYAADSPIQETVVHFSARGDGELRLVPPSRGVPSSFLIDAAFPPAQIYIGNQKASPIGHQFSPYLRDRHGLAWTDYNGDGALDVFISRGGVGGMLRKLPGFIQNEIRDELLVSGGTPRFDDVTLASGIEKKGCSGRHARWTDFDHDGRIDLFVNCQDRGNVQGVYAKQLYRQGADGRLSDVANAVGLGLPGRELIDFVWMDVDGDGAVDLFTSEDRGFFLYRNVGGKFAQEFVHRTEFARADIEGLKSEVNNYWRFDGKLTVADFDGDGALDVFSASKKGNALLRGEGGKFRHVDPASVGLPTASLVAHWVDYDNDGLMDLHAVPDGLYRQIERGRFERTGLLVLPDRKYQAAVVHWYDRDNDGRPDVLIALNENPGLWPSWKKRLKTRDDAFLWTLHAYRNVGAQEHWLQVELDGPPGNRQGIGARVTLHDGGRTWTQTVGASEGAYFSQGHYRLYFGLGERPRVERMVVRWSDGKLQELTDVAADRLARIVYDDTTD